ncbi:MAG: efflux RND transporter periplasmic adaptor subunit [Acidobacteriota bacterium]
MCRASLLQPILLALAVVSTVSCQTAQDVDTGLREALSRGEVVRELLLTGELRAVRSIAIKAPETSIFQMRIQFMAEEGSFVKAGDPLLDFDNSSLVSQALDLESRILDAETRIVAKRNEVESSLKTLEIELAQAEHDAEQARLQAAVDENLLSRKVWQERQLASSSAERRLDEARKRIGSTRRRGQADLAVLEIERDKLEADLGSARQDADLLSIKAPAEGLVVYERRQQSTARFQEGDSCWPGSTVVRLPDLDEMEVLFHVNEVDAPLLTVGTPVDLELDSFPGETLRGVVRSIPSMAVKRDETSRIAVFQVVAELEETWRGRMKPGMSVRGRLVVERLSDVPRIRRGVVQHDGERYYVELPGSSPEEPRQVGLDVVSRDAVHLALTEDSWSRLQGQVGAPS